MRKMFVALALSVLALSAPVAALAQPPTEPAVSAYDDTAIVSTPADTSAADLAVLPEADTALIEPSFEQPFMFDATFYVDQSAGAFRQHEDPGRYIA